jgi:uncharacterized protein
VSKFSRRLERLVAPLPPEPKAATEDRLRALRASLGAALGDHAEAASRAHQIDAVALADFERITVPSGVLLRRRVDYPLAHAVGSEVLRPAVSVDASYLALLALDPKLVDCSAEGALYIDTETTGLAGGTGTLPFLIGIAYLVRGLSGEQVVRLEQYFVPNFGEETPALEALRARVEAASMLVSFNGKSFDMPLLRTRYLINRVTPPVEPPHLDLLHMARRIHRDPLQKKSAPTRLVALEENVLGYMRTGDIAGADIAAHYLHFARTGDTTEIARILDHNLWDVLAMVALVGFYGTPPAVSRLSGAALAGVARTLGKADAPAMAALVSDLAVTRGGGSIAHHARAGIAKARQDRAQALADYEAVLAKVPSPAVRLELAKLYEHHCRDYARAAALNAAGTSESAPAAAHRAARLQSKGRRQDGTSLFLRADVSTEAAGAKEE